jgi:hypothetical protein
MTFLNIYVQPLSLYPGAIIPFNYLYERHEISFYKENKDHLLSIFYFDSSKEERRTVLIHISASLRENKVQCYFIKIYKLTDNFSELHHEKEAIIKSTINSMEPIWKIAVKNQFSLFFQLRKLSYNIGRRLSFNKTLEPCLSKFDIYKEEIINPLENGMQNILDFICLKTKIDSNDIERNFLTSLMITHHNIVRVENWNAVWQLYHYQKDHTAWHEAVKWIRKEVTDYRKQTVISNLMGNLINFKSI